MIIEVEGEDAGSLDIVPQVSWTGPIPFPGEVGVVVVSGRSKSEGAGTGLEREWNQSGQAGEKWVRFCHTFMGPSANPYF